MNVMLSHGATSRVHDVKQPWQVPCVAATTHPAASLRTHEPVSVGEGDGGGDRGAVQWHIGSAFCAWLLAGCSTRNCWPFRVHNLVRGARDRGGVGGGDGG